MKIKTIITTDGSNTVMSETFNETYHSIHGAVAESKHVFIEAGFNVCNKSYINIFEVGFGTGLNAFLTFIEAQKLNMNVNYYTVELYPLDEQVVKSLQYHEYLNADHKTFQKIHHSPWNEPVNISHSFVLKKMNIDLCKADIPDKIDLVYFDAFSPSTQPELWTQEIFDKLYNHMSPDAILTTYCAKGVIRRTMQKAGFIVERLAGAPPKREMLRGRKGEGEEKNTGRCPVVLT
jgi:tRNA U34 5-methylaminomethyl-2-thiouridine-forming methyltransferase MnmC